MSYRMLYNGFVYDGPDYLGQVTTGLFASRGKFDVLMSGRVIATLPTREDAAEWLVCEHRDIPWADRPEAQRIAANVLHLTD